VKYGLRSYDPLVAVTFRFTRAKYGGFSNMARGFPLTLMGVKWGSAEALYQACRFPHREDVQRRILQTKTPKAAKEASRSEEHDTRHDWDRVRIHVMRWCLGVKLAQHFARFGRLFEGTGDRAIVEESTRDSFWGARRENAGLLVGVNALGRLLMELRSRYSSPERYALLRVTPPRIRDMALLGHSVGIVDMRPTFLLELLGNWQSTDFLPEHVRSAAQLWSDATIADLPSLL
jgi:ribA/ribD-fused uncharacterized protein